MNEVRNQDSRGYFVLPQAPEEASYYAYGTPRGGAGQYSSPRMLTFILQLEFQWGAIDDRKFGIGNISLFNGRNFPPHRTHKTGLEVDMRPIRKDGKQLPVRWTDNMYDRVATQKLVDLMWKTGFVKQIGFNDVSIRRVRGMRGHDDHMHVQIIA